jgi:uncharacterized membrane protein YoaK (UPF0700 family)
MFSREGSARPDSQNRRVAGYLAFVGGFVNSSGFVLIGTFTSHVTGNVGRLANDAALGNYAAAAAALTLVFSFFAGAFCASVIVESRFFGRTALAYTFALAVEAFLLLVFTGLSYVTMTAHARVQDAEALLLCAAMGIQNALITRLSGAVVRTTHLTGVVTDLGIECARWFRFWRKSLGDATHLSLVFGRNVAERPALPKILLLGTIAASFFVGATCGAFSAVRFHHAAMLVAAAAVGACSVYASRSERLPASERPGA